jgi:hypothetical protein
MRSTRGGGINRMVPQLPCPPEYPSTEPVSRNKRSEVIQVVALPRFTVTLLAFYATVQLALPLRSYSAKETSAWSFRGFNLAWRGMIAEKQALRSFMHATAPPVGIGN